MVSFLENMNSLNNEAMYSSHADKEKGNFPELQLTNDGSKINVF